VTKKAYQNRKRQARNKYKKQQRLLFEIVIPKDQFKLTLKEVEDEVIVFDGGNNDTQPILPPDGLTWRSIQVSTLHIHDMINHHFGLTITHSNNCHPFIPLPRGISLKILGKASHNLIYSALEACERLWKAILKGAHYLCENKGGVLVLQIK